MGLRNANIFDTQPYPDDENERLNIFYSLLHKIHPSPIAIGNALNQLGWKLNSTEQLQFVVLLNASLYTGIQKIGNDYQFRLDDEAFFGISEYGSYSNWVLSKTPYCHQFLEILNNSNWLMANSLMESTGLSFNEVHAYISELIEDKSVDYKDISTQDRRDFMVTITPSGRLKYLNKYYKNPPSGRRIDRIKEEPSQPIHPETFMGGIYQKDVRNYVGSGVGTQIINHYPATPLVPASSIPNVQPSKWKKFWDKFWWAIVVPLILAAIGAIIKVAIEHNWFGK